VSGEDVRAELAALRAQVAALQHKDRQFEYVAAVFYAAGRDDERKDAQQAHPAPSGPPRRRLWAGPGSAP
jgi:ferric-dicitrate binding protein FerR (iron transport regulator)